MTTTRSGSPRGTVPDSGVRSTLFGTLASGLPFAIAAVGHAVTRTYVVEEVVRREIWEAELLGWLGAAVLHVLIVQWRQVPVITTVPIVFVSTFTSFTIFAHEFYAFVAAFFCLSSLGISAGLSGARQWWCRQRSG